MIEYKCNCGFVIKVGEKAAGKKGRCPKCKASVQLPAATRPVSGIPPGIPELELQPESENPVAQFRKASASPPPFQDAAWFQSAPTARKKKADQGTKRSFFDFLKILDRPKLLIAIVRGFWLLTTTIVLGFAFIFWIVTWWNIGDVKFYPEGLKLILIQFIFLLNMIIGGVVMIVRADHLKNLADEQFVAIPLLGRFITAIGDVQLLTCLPSAILPSLGVFVFATLLNPDFSTEEMPRDILSVSFQSLIIIVGGLAAFFLSRCINELLTVACSMANNLKKIELKAK